MSEGSTTRWRGARRAAVAIGVAGAMTLSACASSPPADEQVETVTLVFASHTADNAAEMRAVQWWVDRVNELTDDALVFEANYNGSIVAGTDAAAAVRDGRIDAAFHASFYNPAEFPLTMVGGVPFLTDNAEAHTMALDELFQNNEAFQAEYLDQNLRPLYFLALGSSVLGTKSAAHNVEDLSGLRIRAGGLVVDALQAVGAEPIGMDFGEVYQALERNVIDGYASVGMTAAYTSGFLEVAPFIANPGIGLYLASSFIINEDLWQGLPEDVRAAMEQAASEVRTERIRLLNEAASDVCDAIIEDEGEVVIWSPDDVDDLRGTIGDTLAEKWITTATESGIVEDDVRAVYAAFVDSITELSATSDYVDPLTACSER